MLFTHAQVRGHHWRAQGATHLTSSRTGGSTPEQAHVWKSSVCHALFWYLSRTQAVPVAYTVADGDGALPCGRGRLHDDSP